MINSCQDRIDELIAAQRRPGSGRYFGFQG